jgi:heptosyltransferase-2
MVVNDGPMNAARDALVDASLARLRAGGRVLVSRLQYLGDVVLTLPLVQVLHDRFPAAEIDYLTRDQGADVLQGEPRLSRVFRVPDRGRGIGDMWRLIAGLRERRYAATIDLYSNPRSALLCRLTGAPVRIGGARRIRRRLYTHPVRVHPGVRAASAHHLYYLRPLGIEAEPVRPTLTLSDGEREGGRVELGKLGVAGDAPVIGVHPGGKWEVKRWPVEQFADLCHRLREHHGAEVVVFCGPGEETYRDALVGAVGGKARVLPVLPLRRAAAVIASLAAVVVCDGGIMHLSVALGTPTVGIFGSSEPDIWFPYEKDGPYRAAFVDITCRPCHSHTCSHVSCLRRLSVDGVERRVEEVLRAVRQSDRFGVQ